MTQDKWLKVFCVSTSQQGNKSEMLILVVPIIDVPFLPMPGRKNMSFLENFRLDPVASCAALDEGRNVLGQGAVKG